MNNEIVQGMQHLPLVVGVDVGGTWIRAAVLRSATLLSRVELPTGHNPTPERVIPRIFSAVQQSLEEANTNLDDILGIGVGVAGELDSRTGVIYSSPNLPSWEKIPLSNILEQQLNLTIYVENDANLAALAEYEFGAGCGYQDVVYLTISTGIGGGVIINGRLMEGASGTGGEIGHMTIDLQGGQCNCGNIGCLEHLASGTAIARLANEAISAGKGEELLSFIQRLEERGSMIDHATDKSEQPLLVDARIVALAAEAGVPLACSIIAKAAEALGVGLVNVVQIFNPERIILGGSVAKIGPMLLEPAKHIVEQRSIKVFRDAVQIVQGQLGGNAGLIGAAVLVYQKKRDTMYSGMKSL